MGARGRICGAKQEEKGSVLLFGTEIERERKPDAFGVAGFGGSSVEPMPPHALRGGWSVVLSCWLLPISGDRIS